MPRRATQPAEPSSNTPSPLVVVDAPAPATVLPMGPRKRVRPPGRFVDHDTAEPNMLWYGDNIDVLRDHVASDSVDLVYLDPPFKSDKSYNVLFQEPSGQVSPAQFQAFTDTWTWTIAADEALARLSVCPNIQGRQLLPTLCAILRKNAFSAYLVMMAERLIEIHRVLKRTGSVYIHCDPTASHYLKVVMDLIFGIKNFRNEIIWHYNTGGKGRKTFLRKHDVILWYSKTDDYVFNRDAVALPRMVGTAHLRQGIDEDGREYYEDYSPRKSGKQYRWYLDDGLTPMDVWTDIQALNPAAKERIGYPTQKPIALLQRIISASSNPDDVVLDPFCGCGTAVIAAEKLGRRWIGIDITSLAIAVIERRLSEIFDAPSRYEVGGLPKDKDGAERLRDIGRHQFEWWVIAQLHAVPHDGRWRKGADQGVDGIMTFFEPLLPRPKLCVVQVKSGHVGAKDIRELKGTVSNMDGAEIGLFVTLEPPTPPMVQEARRAGIYWSDAWQRHYPRIQILTIDDLLARRMPDLPPQVPLPRAGPRIRGQSAEQQSLPIRG